MRVRILVVGIFWVLLPALTLSAVDASKRSISLQECIDLALSRNLDLQVERHTAELARYALQGAYGPYDPSFTFRALREHVDAPADFDPHKFSLDFPYILRQDTLSAALEGSTPIGLSYRLNTRAGTKDASTDFNADFGDANDFLFGIRNTNNAFASADVSVRQHLLKDFWIDQDRASIRVRQKELKMTEQALRFQVMRVVLAVELAYYDLIVARQQVRVEEQSLELNQQLVAETRRRVDVGDLPPLDAEQAETQLQNTLTALAAVREALNNRENALKFLLTDDFRQWSEIELEPADTLVAVPVNVDRSQSFQQALALRPDLAEARLGVEKTAVNVQFRYNQLFPSLDLVGSYGDSSVESGLSRAVGDTYMFREPDYAYGVVLSFPLANTAGRNQYAASKTARELAKLQLKKAEQGVFLQVADWVNRVQSRFSQVASTRKARGYAESALESEQKKWQNGLSTAFFVLQAQATLTMARSAEVLSLADYNRALAQLAFAEGNTLQKHHVTVEVK